MGVRKKTAYTRDGRSIDNTMRSAEEAALLERVQGHSMLAPPGRNHPSIAMYISEEDGRSLITGESTTIEPKRLEMSDIGPKWQVEKQLDEAVKAEHKKTHIDYSILQPRKKGSGWVPEAHRGGGGGHSASEFDHGSGGTSRPLSPTGGAAKATPRAVNPHPVGTALSWWSRVDHAAASLTKVVAR